MVATPGETRRAVWARWAVLSVGWLSCIGAGWNENFDPVTRAKMILALLGVIVLGIGMIVALVLGGRFLRRRIHVKSSQASRIYASDWPDRPRRKPPTEVDEPE